MRRGFKKNIPRRNYRLIREISLNIPQTHAVAPKVDQISPPRQGHPSEPEEYFHPPIETPEGVTEHSLLPDVESVLIIDVPKSLPPSPKLTPSLQTPSPKHNQPILPSTPQTSGERLVLHATPSLLNADTHIFSPKPTHLCTIPHKPATTTQTNTAPQIHQNTHKPSISTQLNSAPQIHQSTHSSTHKPVTSTQPNTTHNILEKTPVRRAANFLYHAGTQSSFPKSNQQSTTTQQHTQTPNQSQKHKSPHFTPNITPQQPQNWNKPFVRRAAKPISYAGALLTSPKPTQHHTTPNNKHHTTTSLPNLPNITHSPHLPQHASAPHLPQHASAPQLPTYTASPPKALTPILTHYSPRSPTAPRSLPLLHPLDHPNFYLINGGCAANLPFYAGPHVWIEKLIGVFVRFIEMIGHWRP